MNKAFTKEDDDSTPLRLPDLPISEHPNHVTPRGLELLQERQAVLQEEVARLRRDRPDQDDPMPLAVAERDLRYVDARLASAILVAPPTTASQVSFGATVTVEDEDGKNMVYTIVGEDEADPQAGLIAAFSPLARALMEARVGDVVEWPKPSGSVDLEVMDIRFQD